MVDVALIRSSSHSESMVKTLFYHEVIILQHLINQSKSRKKILDQFLSSVYQEDQI